MAKTWYPMVDAVSCIECGDCVTVCTHGVWQQMGSFPVVKNPAACEDHCRQCGEICPVGSISYLGEDSDWIPPVLRTKGGMPDTAPRCCCGQKLY